MSNFDFHLELDLRLLSCFLRATASIRGRLGVFIVVLCGQILPLRFSLPLTVSASVAEGIMFVSLLPGGAAAPVLDEKVSG